MVCLSNKEDRERDQARVSITSSLVQCHTPGLVIKITRINFEGLFELSMKISTLLGDIFLKNCNYADVFQPKGKHDSITSKLLINLRKMTQVSMIIIIVNSTS